MAAPERGTIVLVISGPIERAHIPDICERLGALVEGSQADRVICDVGALAPDAVTVDALARLQLIVQRLGRRILVRHACDELRALLILTGLRDVVPLDVELALESKLEPE